MRAQGALDARKAREVLRKGLRHQARRELSPQTPWDPGAEQARLLTDRLVLQLRFFPARWDSGMGKPLRGEASAAWNKELLAH